jgi:hypothetical protein
MRNIDWAQAYQDVQEQRRPTGAQRRERQSATRAERESDTSRTGIQRASDIISGRSREEGNAIRDKARADQQAQSSQLRQRTVSDLATGAKNALEAGAQAVGGAAKNVERKRLGGEMKNTAKDIKTSGRILTPDPVTPNKTEPNKPDTPKPEPNKPQSRASNLPASAAGTSAAGMSNKRNVDGSTPAHLDPKKKLSSPDANPDNTSNRRTSPTPTSGGGKSFTPQTGNQNKDMQTWAKANPTLAAKVKPGQTGYKSIQSVVKPPKVNKGSVKSTSSTVKAPKPPSTPKVSSPKPMSRIDAATTNVGKWNEQAEAAYQQWLDERMYRVAPTKAEKMKSDEKSRTRKERKPSTLRRGEVKKWDQAQSRYVSNKE